MPERSVGFPIRYVPDWVCEVLSPSNAQHDLQVKRRAYHAAKVGYYWNVDPKREDVTILPWSLDGYLIVEVETGDGVLRAPPFELAEIRLAGLFGKE
ncbi:MAG: Uma2 family endonuclease [Myxococcales bacterium]|nr:Uma2 family endonuclease [Myxococcales bacterium]